MKCPNCGKAARVVRGNYLLQELEIPVKLLSIELIKCVHCGNVDPVIPSLDGLMDLVALNLISSRSLLSGGEVRFLRKYIGKSAQDFARPLHVDHTHLSKIENGRVVIGAGLDKLVRLVVLLSSPGLRRKRKELLELLPEIEAATDAGFTYVQIAGWLERSLGFPISGKHLSVIVSQLCQQRKGRRGKSKAGLDTLERLKADAAAEAGKRFKHDPMADAKRLM